MSEAQDPALCDELVARLGELRASWAEIADLTGAASGPSRPLATPGRAAEPGTTVTI